MTDDTEITPTAEAPEVLTAWALDDEPIGANAPIVPSGTIERHGRLTTAGLAIVVAGVAAAGILLGATYLTWPTPKAAEPVHVSAPSSQPNVIAPSILAAIPTPHALTPQERDARFGDLMHQALSPTTDVYQRPVLYAQETCKDIADGERTKRSEVAIMVKNNAGTVEQLWYFINTAVDTYCPQYANE